MYKMCIYFDRLVKNIFLGDIFLTYCVIIFYKLLYSVYVLLLLTTLLLILYYYTMLKKTKKRIDSRKKNIK